MAYTRTLASIVAVLTMGTLCLAGEVRSYVSGNYGLSLDGANVGFTKSVEGGAIAGDVISEPVGNDGITRKHIGAPKYQDVKLQIGFSLARPMTDWITASLNPDAPRRNLAISEYDYTMQPKSARQFDKAFITSLVIPAMDGASKEPAYLGVTVMPETIKNASAVAATKDTSEQKIFLPSNFRLEIEGIDCTRISKIDSFEIRREVVADNVGDARDAMKRPAKLVFPNLHIEMAEANAQGFQQWHQQMVVQGQNVEKSGTLILLAPGTSAKELARIRFFNMGIFCLQPAKAEANADQIKRVSADLYVERMTIEFPDTLGGGAAPASPARPTAPPLAPIGARLLR